MEMTIDEHEVRRIAALARLELDDASRFVRPFQDVLELVAVLQELSETGEKPTVWRPQVAPRLREDEPASSLSAERALGNAPERSEDHFRVPRVIDR